MNLTLHGPEFLSRWSDDQARRTVSAKFRGCVSIGVGLIQTIDQRFGNGIKLTEELQNALLIERRQLSILPPFQ